MDSRVTEDTLNLLRGRIDSTSDMIKAWFVPGGPTTGIQNYDLEGPALSLVPVETPLVNMVPVVGGNGGIQANWHAVTGFNTSLINPGLGDGQRGGVTTDTTADYFAKYCSFGLDSFVTEQAEWAAENYMDLVSLAQRNLLWSTKIALEKIYLGGLGTYGLGQANRPTVADIGTGGKLSPNTTYSVIVAALTLDGWLTAAVATGVRGLVSRTNADNSTITYGGGTSQLSANRTVTTANDGNTTHALSASWAAVTGAVAYAVFWGAAGAEILGAILPSPAATQSGQNWSSAAVNSLLITGTATGTQTAASLGATDYSQNSTICDGLLSMVAKTGMNGYIATQATGTAGTGTPLTADGDGGIVEIDTDLKYFYDNFRISPSRIWVSSQELLNIGKKIAQGPGSGSSNLRFVRDASNGQLVGAVIARAYLNKFTKGITGAAADGQEIPINLHPNLPPGTMLYATEQIPYPQSGVNNVMQFRAQKGWRATLWPKVTRRWEFGVYIDGVLQNYFIPAFGLRTNIANG
jgi:hypothetical protein